MPRRAADLASVTFRKFGLGGITRCRPKHSEALLGNSRAAARRLIADKSSRSALRCRSFRRRANTPSDASGPCSDRNISAAAIAEMFRRSGNFVRHTLALAIAASLASDQRFVIPCDAGGDIGRAAAVIPQGDRDRAPITDPFRQTDVSGGTASSGQQSAPKAAHPPEPIRTIAPAAGRSLPRFC